MIIGDLTQCCEINCTVFLVHGRNGFVFDIFVLGRGRQEPQGGLLVGAVSP